jgi:putative spermidine/putrescine transport system ATP-binding protein
MQVSGTAGARPAPVTGQPSGLSDALTSAPRPTAAVAVRGLRKQYLAAAAPAVDDLTFDVRAGEVFGLLGPSGCGKSTALNMIAGFVRPDAGSIMFGGREMSQVPAHKRGVGFVFQDYALFPHLTAGRNIAYGLRVSGARRADIARRTTELLHFVSLAQKADRLPRELSGGEQQRVSLARALATQPQLILLDEPLSSLDTRLREQMRRDIRDLLTRAGVTAIIVTHDRAEAFEMCDRIAVLAAGRVQQVGTPLDLYSAPNSLAVAQLLGDVNALQARALTSAAAGETVSVALASGAGPHFMSTARVDIDAGANGLVLVRPEDIQLRSAAGSEPRFQLDGIEMRGPTVAVRLRADGVQITTVTMRSALDAIQEAGEFAVGWDPVAASFVTGAAAAEVVHP